MNLSVMSLFYLFLPFSVTPLGLLNNYSKDEKGNSYYIYARTRQARSKIRHWFRVHDEIQRTKA
jgi:hypothetical protein